MNPKVAKYLATLVDSVVHSVYTAVVSVTAGKVIGIDMAWKELGLICASSCVVGVFTFLNQNPLSKLISPDDIVPPKP